MNEESYRTRACVNVRARHRRKPLSIHITDYHGDMDRYWKQIGGHLDFNWI